MSSYGKNDPLRYEHSTGAQTFGGFSYRMRYDVSFSRNIYSGIVFALAVAALIYSVVAGNTTYMAVAGGLLVLAALIFVIYPMVQRYDIGSSVAYCRRQLGPGASDQDVRACTERREDKEDLMSAIAYSYY